LSWEDFGAEKIHCFISTIFRKVNTGGLIAGGSVLISGGLFVPARTRFLRQKITPLNRKNWNGHGVIPTYRVTPLGVNTLCCFHVLSFVNYFVCNDHVLILYRINEIKIELMYNLPLGKGIPV
jgi:hypothetical protein